MTLDEAIEHCYDQAHRQLAGHCEGCAEDHIQLAKWLTELKIYKNHILEEYK